MKSEASIQNAVRAEAAKYGYYLWRNNSGVLQDSRGVPVRFGLGNDSAKLNEKLKSSDLIGLGPDGRFVAVECKPENWIGVRTERERAQEAFINLVIANGGKAGFCTCMVDMYRILNQ